MDALSISAGSSHSSYVASAVAEAPKVRVQAASDAAGTTNAEQSANSNSNAGSGAAPPTQDSLQKAIDKANKVLEAKTSNELRFAVDKETGLSVVKMINQESGKTILQFPSEAMLAIAKSIDQVTGTIVNRKA